MSGASKKAARTAPAAPRSVKSAVQAYHATLKEFADRRVSHEGATETAFSRLLADTARPRGWTLVPKQGMKADGKLIIPDGTLLDQFDLRRGFWEAKDTKDDLEVEIERKVAKKYPLSNIIFEDTRRAVLFQHARPVDKFDLTRQDQVVDLLSQFYAFTEPDVIGFERAIEEFSERVPELGRKLDAKVKEAHERNKSF